MDARGDQVVTEQVPQAPIRPGRRLPEWIKVRVTEGENYKELKELVRSQRLHTVCEEAQCPNIYDCWNRRTATFMILGAICTLPGNERPPNHRPALVVPPPRLPRA